MTSESFLLDEFRVTARDIQEVDVAALQTLSVSVGWSHRAGDWNLLREVGHGLVAMDETGRIHGSVMWFCFGNRHATVGMLITTPRLQSCGGGQWLMKLAMARLEGRLIGLHATARSHRLCRSLGFVDQEKVIRHQGHVSHVARLRSVPDGEFRALTAADAATVVALDPEATGWDRSALINALLARSEGLLLTRGERIEGYALVRPFGRGKVIGPVIAQSTDDSLALVHALLDAHKDTFMRIDTRGAGDPVGRLARSCGLGSVETVTRMARGGAWPFSPTDGPRQFAIASQTTG